MSAISLFDFDGHAVRVLDLDGKPWWVASDIANVLEYSQTSSMMRMLDEDQKGVHEVYPLQTKGTHETRTLGGRQRMGIITEGGLWTCVLRSQHEQAKAFTRWLTDVLLPALREHGRFEFEPQDEDAAPSPVTEVIDLREKLLFVREARTLGGRAAGRRAWHLCGLPDVFDGPLALPVDDASVLDDTIEAWMAERVEPSSGRVGSTALYGDYQHWCFEARRGCVSHAKFGRYLKARGVRWINSNGIYYQDISLRPSG